MAGEDRERWNARYREEGAPPEPSPFVEGLDAVLPRGGRALDVGGGAGRHALWLARRGLAVTLADVSDVALAQAARAAEAEGLALSTVRVDLEAEPLPSGPFDLVLCTYFLHRPLFAAFPAALAPGGLLVFAHATRSNLLRHARPGPAHVLEDGELPGLVRGLEVVSYVEGWLESGRHEARLVARRPPARAHAAGGAGAGARSANTNPSRSTTSPGATAIGRASIGPAATNVWNSPFSPHGSTPAGRAASSAAS
jgi:SAM-dependent methyltransferase